MHLVGFIIRIYHDTRSAERQKQDNSMSINYEIVCSLYKRRKVKIQNNCNFLKNRRPTLCHLLFYFTSFVLNMFRTLIYPSRGACDYSVELPHWSYCSWFDVCWIFGVAGLEWYPCCRLIIRSLRLFC